MILLSREEPSEEDIPAEESEEDFNLDMELDELDLEEEETDKKEESFFTNHSDQPLNEQLTEEVDLDVSAEEFEKLINSSEFKKPISDSSARAMLNDLENEEDPKELKEWAETEEETFVDFDDNAFKDAEATEETDVLTEGIFDKVKDKLAGAVDKITSSLKSREAKADWILANALEDDAELIVNDGELAPQEENRKFQVFLIIGFKDRYTNGKLITMPPSFNNKDLVAGMPRPQVAQNYKSADSYAKGWSEKQGNGPAFIYLAKDAEDKDAIFLCEYFKGKLEKDQVDRYFEIIKKDLKARKHMAKSGIVQDMEESVEVVECADIVDEDIALSNIMDNLDELQENYLEDAISKSLIESYGNVAGYRLKTCTFLNEELNINGTIYFTSGNTRETTYTFKEAFTNKSNQVKLHGFNEKLGLEKVFSVVGHIDESSKTFITESFTYLKK